MTGDERVGPLANRRVAHRRAGRVRHQAVAARDANLHPTFVAGERGVYAHETIPEEVRGSSGEITGGV